MDLTANPVILPATPTPGTLFVTCKLAPILTPLNPALASSLPTDFVSSFGETSNGVLVQASNASLAVWASSFTLSRSPFPLPQNSYDSNFQAVSFPFSYTPSSLSVTTPEGIAKFQTATGVPAPATTAFWSLPWTEINTAAGSAPPATQRAASSTGFGGVSLNLGNGLTADFLGTLINCKSPVDPMVDLVNGLRIYGNGTFLRLGPQATLWNSSSSLSLGKLGIGVPNPFFTPTSVDKNFLLLVEI